MASDDLAALHARALKLETELDDAVRENDRLRLDLGSPAKGQLAATVTMAVGVVLAVLAVIYVGTAVPAHRRAVDAANAAGGAL